MNIHVCTIYKFLYERRSHDIDYSRMLSKNIQKNASSLLHVQIWRVFVKMVH